jgi:hypothetical protein
VVKKLDDEFMALVDGAAFVVVPVATGKFSEKSASEEKSLARGAQEREKTSPAAESSWHWHFHPPEPIARVIHNPPGDNSGALVGEQPLVETMTFLWSQTVPKR